MYELIIKDYINRLTEEDILNLANKKNISLSDDEIKIIYLYAKNYWKVFYKGDPTDIIKELKEKINPTAFNEMYKMYLDFKRVCK